MTDLPLLNTLDLEILMHKEAHFGGSFEMMIDYYENDGIGVQEEFEIERIKELSLFDKEGHLADDVLPDMAKLDVTFSQELYKKFKECYEEDIPLPQRLADLILSEEISPVAEIESLAVFKKEAIKPLTEVLLQDYFYNSLNPGYGRAPINAAYCLKAINDEEAIPFLFNALGKSFMVDEAIIDALISFGTKAEEFLCDRLKSTPYTRDNYTAAMALSSFPISDETAQLALYQLGEKETFKHDSYPSYLICICEGLESDEAKERFSQLLEDKSISQRLKDEMKIIISFWKK